MAIIDFESICVQEDKFRDIVTTNWIGKHARIFLSVSSKLIEQPNDLCKSNHRALVESFVDALDGLTTQSGEQTKFKFLEIETRVKSEFNQIFSAPN